MFPQIDATSEVEEILFSLLVGGVLLLGALAGIYVISLFMKRFLRWIYEKRRKMFHEKGFTACPECGRSFSGNPHPLLSRLWDISSRSLVARLNPLNKIRALREGLKYMSGQKHPLENLTFCRTCGEPNDETLPQEESKNASS